MGLRRRFGICLVATTALSGCAYHGLAFRQDDRIHLSGLPDRSSITLPHDITWTFDGDLTGPATAFAILIDWTPPPPGHSLESLLAADPTCQHPTGCPDGYLERNRIYVTTDLRFTIDNVARGTDREERRNFHDLTVILVDADGDRVGETAAASRFRVPGIG